MKPDRIGRYAIVSELGKGSMGVVYEGQPDGGGAPVAIKVFYPDTKLPTDELEHLKERFEREGAALAHLHHPNVVRVLEAGEEAGFEYIVMEKLAGYNLKELFELGTRFTLAETFEIMLQLLAGLSATHRAGLVHRDVKPANVVRSPQGKIILTDFGIARILTDQTLSRAGTVVGTPNYMSPQQIRGDEVDPRSDIFSAGVLMYELLTAKKPFEGPDVTAIMYNVTTVQPPPPRFYNGSLPRELDELVFRAIAKEPEQRYSTAEEFAEAVRNLEQELHYREGTEAILNALPSSPDPDASMVAPVRTAGAAAGLHPSTASVAVQPGFGAATGLTAQAAATAGIPFGGAHIQPSIAYCVDCGMSNPESSEFCSRCMRPLLKRALVHQLAQQQAKMMTRNSRGDYVFLTCLSIIMVGVLIMILFLFFRGVR